MPEKCVTLPIIKVCELSMSVHYVDIRTMTTFIIYSVVADEP